MDQDHEENHMKIAKRRSLIIRNPMLILTRKYSIPYFDPRSHFVEMLRPRSMEIETRSECKFSVRYQKVSVRYTN